MRWRGASGFAEGTESLAAFAGAMSHPARVEIVRLLMERGEMCCSELVGELPLAQATVSQHLRVLEREGLVSSRGNGMRVEYRLEAERLRSFCHAFQQALNTGDGEEKANEERVR